MTTVKSEAWRLMIEWKRTLQRRESEGSLAADHAEQEAYDELVDYVEEHGLNYTKYDPRGPREG